MTARSTRRRVLGVVALALCCVATVSAGALFLHIEGQRDAAMPDPSPNGTWQPHPDGFPMVDWDYWAQANPDIIGWVTIPGTSIDLPIAQGPADDPDYYLSHDAYGNYNPYGCPYLDAECAEMGLLSRNSVIFAHHASDCSMFSEIASFSDPAFASEHGVILLQTPEWKATLTPRMVSVVDASKEPKQTSFASDAEYGAWWQEKRSAAALDIDAAEMPVRTYSFVTCSYSTWRNERTVVYAARKGSGGLEG